MATHHFRSYAGAPSRFLRPHVPEFNFPLLLFQQEQQQQQQSSRFGSKKSRSRLRATTTDSDDGGSGSYLDMWRKAVERERKNSEFQRIIHSVGGIDDDGEPRVEELEKKSEEFQKILQVSSEERDRIQRMQVIDRAAAAIAAARAILKESDVSKPENEPGAGEINGDGGEVIRKQPEEEGTESADTYIVQSETQTNGVPGPDFWSWTPPDSDFPSDTINGLQTAKASGSPTSQNPILEKERSLEFLPIPFESSLSKSRDGPTLPPLQSSMEEEEQRRDALFSANAAEAAHALNDVDLLSSPSSGVNPDGSRWWKETGVERRPDGVICKWTLMRGVSADQAVEWQTKFWEAADVFGYKELGSEKSGRDAVGNVWREFWRESMREEDGNLHMEKTADKWGKNGKGDEWQEQWYEHYGAGGHAEKWAHKWCSIDPNTPLEAGHAHVWHERWGESYDGKGGSMKYTDKWAERSVGDGWEKWGDKWDENFDLNSRGTKQGETWWEGKHGERWNRTWGEQHNGTGWVHKYGKSSSGEHWDTHVQEETWYERFPHFGFYHCFENSVQLREVQMPPET